MKDKLRKIIKRNYVAVRIHDFLKLIYYKYLITDEKFIKKRFKRNIGRELNLENPEFFNDKLQWLKFNWYDGKAVQCTDKYEVRAYVKERIGEKYLNELYGVYESVDEIDFSELPNSFALKGTHGSGYNIICDDKESINLNVEIKKMKRWLKTNYFWENREWVYKDIKPRIICEKFLSEDDGGLPKDYKFFCFDGKPKFMFLASDRGKGTKFDFYDLEWSKIPVSQYYPTSEYNPPKPKRFEEMLDLAKKLSEGFPHVRVDFYVNNDKVIFGELTFFHFSGTKKFMPEKYDEIFGSYLDLSKIENGYYNCGVNS